MASSDRDLATDDDDRGEPACRAGDEAPGGFGSVVLEGPARSMVVASYMCLPEGRPAGRMARHDHAVVLYYTRGQALFEQRQRLSVGEGDVVIVPAGEAHRMLEVDGAAGWGVGLQPACMASPEKSWLLEPFARVRRGAVAAARVAPERRVFLEAMLRELSEATAHPGAHQEQRVDALLTLVLGEVSRAQSDAAPALASVVGEALAFIEQHCTEGISLRDVAAAVRRSPAHLTTATRQATGRSVGAWITAGRMAEARRRLLHSDERVDVIGERVGYADATHFIRIFRQNHGETPAAWRRSRQAERGPLDTLRQRS